MSRSLMCLQGFHIPPCPHITVSSVAVNSPSCPLLSVRDAGHPTGQNVISIQSEEQKPKVHFTSCDLPTEKMAGSYQLCCSQVGPGGVLNRLRAPKSPHNFVSSLPSFRVIHIQLLAAAAVLGVGGGCWAGCVAPGWRSGPPAESSCLAQGVTKQLLLQLLCHLPLPDSTGGQA